MTRICDSRKIGLLTLWLFLANSVAVAQTQTGAVNPIAMGSANPVAPKPAATAPVNDGPGPMMGVPINFEYRVAAKIQARADARQILVTLPIPQDWPEQSVVAVSEEVPPATNAMEVRILPMAPRQMVAVLAALPGGEAAIFSLTYDVQVYPIMPPANPEEYTIPEDLDKDMQHWLDDSPGISFKDSRFRRLVAEITSETVANDWQRVNQIREWIQTNIQPSNEANKDTTITIRNKSGTSEDRHRLFVALCRASKIPARMVWSDGTEYSEFYLQHGDDKGFWFPCIVSPSVELGANPTPGVIQQKGDHFRVPEKKREELNFVTGFISAKSSAQPAFGYVEGQVRK